MELAQKCAINEKSTIFVQFCSNFAYMTISWIGQFDKVSLILDKNCRFFINDTFLSQFHFLCISLYIIALELRIYSSLFSMFFNLCLNVHCASAYYWCFSVRLNPYNLKMCNHSSISNVACFLESNCV